MEKRSGSLVLLSLLLLTLLFGGCGGGSGSDAAVQAEPPLVFTEEELAALDSTQGSGEQAGDPQATAALWDWWRNWYSGGTTGGDGSTGGSTGGDGSTGGGTTDGGSTTTPPTTACTSVIDGYGKSGPYTMTYESFANPMWSGGTAVTVFLPKERTDPAPVMFFSHGYGGTSWSGYRTIISHLASRGFVVVFSPYPTTTSSVTGRYDIMWNGFVLATQKYSSRMNLQQVGFLGHSFGGGAVPSMTRRGLERGWGSQGVITYPMAPWYVYDMTSTQLASFPARVKMIVQVYDEDTINDHRMGIDIFKSTTSIPASEKAYYNLVKGTYSTSHFVPSDREVNELDAQAVRKPLDALIDYTFNIGTCGAEAKAYGLDGQGVHFQSTVTKYPVAVAAESMYSFSWSSFSNPRR